MKVGMLANPRSRLALKTAAEIAGFLKKRKVGVEKIRGRFHGDLAICCGGDGTLLYALQRLDPRTPLLGVNCGYIGFLMDLDAKNWRAKLPRILDGFFYVDQRTRIAASCGKKKLPLALNEVAIEPRESAIALYYTLEVNGQRAWEDVADGIMVATPTGSTAYSLSAGGPVVGSDANVFVVTPINSVKHTGRCLVAPASAKIKIKDICSSVPVDVVVDGQSRVGCGKDVTLVAGEDALLVRSKPPSYTELYQKIRKKVYE